MMKTKTKRKRKNKKTIENENEKIENENAKTAELVHSTKVLAYNAALTGATAVRRWICD